MARSRTGSGPPWWTGWSRRRSPGSCPRPRRPAARRRRWAALTRRARPGLVRRHLVVHGEVDLADALDLDQRYRSARPSWPTSAPPTLDVRRSEALGEMARHQLALDLDTTGDTARPTTTTAAPATAVRPPGGAARAPLRRGDHHPGRRLHLARVANTRAFVDAEQVRDWCGLPGTAVTIKPVVDLAEHLHVDRTRSPTGSPSKPPNATSSVCSRGAPAPPRSATSTT